MKSILCFCLLVFSAPVLAAECGMGGQFVITGTGDQQAMLICTTDQMGSLKPQPFYTHDLLPILDAYKKDPKFIDSLKVLGLGSSYDEIKKTLATTQGAAKLNVDAVKNTEALQYVTDQINYQTGVSGELMRRKGESLAAKADQERREKTPLAVNEDLFKDAADKNTSTFKSFDTTTCAGPQRDADKKLKIFKVTFADGLTKVIVPTGEKKAADGIIDITYLAQGKAYGQDVPESRSLKIKDGKAVWVSDDGKEYPVAKFTEMTSAEAIGLARPMGWGDRPDTCLWAANYKSSTTAKSATPGVLPASSKVEANQ